MDGVELEDIFGDLEMADPLTFHSQDAASLQADAQLQRSGSVQVVELADLNAALHEDEGVEEEQEEEEEEEECEDEASSASDVKEQNSCQDNDSDESYRPAFPRRVRRKHQEEAIDLSNLMLQGNINDFKAELGKRPDLLLSTDLLGRTALHLALLRSRPDVVSLILDIEDKGIVATALNKPFLGSGSLSKDIFPSLHLALAGLVSSKDKAAAIACLRLLLAQPAINVHQADNSKRTALHQACIFGSVKAINLLLDHRADAGHMDSQRCLPLHYAIDSRDARSVQRLLEVSEPERFLGQLHPFYRCIDRQAWEAAILVHRKGWPILEGDLNRLFDYATSRGFFEEWSAVCQKGVEGCSEALDDALPAEISENVSTAVVTHPLCLGHGSIPVEVEDPKLRQQLIRQSAENPHRLEILCGERGILKSDLFRDLKWNNDPSAAPLVDILRVHEFSYVQKLVETVKSTASVDGQPFAKKTFDKGDTKVTPESWNAALRACGAVLDAVDQVCGDHVRNAFCAIRPPGHHLGPAGACDNRDLEDDEEGSQGFCLLNNVAIGAAYARCVYRHLIHKIAIVDFDVHHGNGTEAVVKNVKMQSNRKAAVTELSIDGFRTRIVSTPAPKCKPWLDPDIDAENIFFASIHAYGSSFYPGTGASSSSLSPRIVNVALPTNSSSTDFRNGFQSKILPQLQAFNPDLLFISAGFDGHGDDLIGSFRLTEEDFAWATQQLVAVANHCCNGKLVSVLEGGYNTRAEVLSPFAASVAAHVRTLMFTSQHYTFVEVEEITTNNSLVEKSIGDDEANAEIVEADVGDNEIPSSVAS